MGIGIYLVGLNMRVGDRFDAIVTGDEVGKGKPDPAIYRLVAERLNETPESLLVVEDAVSGVKSARAAGMRCLGVASPERAEALRARSTARTSC